jgi:hypothetical protein
MHGSVHYQQTGYADYLSNPDLGPNARAGERGDGAIGINTYCGSHENSPRFTCAGCHVGNGRYPNPVLPATEAEKTAELSNIDCLTCHQEQYKRFPAGDPAVDFEPLTLVLPEGYEYITSKFQLQDIPNDVDLTPSIFTLTLTGIDGVPKWSHLPNVNDADFEFEPAGTDNSNGVNLMGMSSVQAASTVHPTTNKSCLNCHGGAGGGDGTKRGDLSSALAESANPGTNLDVHMSHQSGGQGMNCSACHDAGGHRLLGRGVDLRPSDVPDLMTCETGGCHDSTPHSSSDLNSHTARVACQTCHIPTYAKVVATEVSRDWTQPHFSSAACNGRGGWLPKENKGTNLTPSYQWFDGTSQVYLLGESLDDYPMKSGAYTLGVPNGSIDQGGAKIYPMKEHTSISAVDDTNRLIAHSTFEFFRTGDFDNAVTFALEQMGRDVNEYAGTVAVHTYQSINHGVEPKESALGCNDCHGSTDRMDLQGELGYLPKDIDPCDQCHSSRSRTWSFTQKHDHFSRYSA